MNQIEWDTLVGSNNRTEVTYYIEQNRAQYQNTFEDDTASDSNVILYEFNLIAKKDDVLQLQRDAKICVD